VNNTMTITTRGTIGLALVATRASAGVVAARRQEQPPAGQPILHAMFQDHAILQRDRPIDVYGQATSGAVV
jgi:sialate O-acetylesterase